MEIISAEILRVKLSLVKPFTTSFSTLSERELVVIKLNDKKGLCGFGEAPVLSLPLYGPETPESVIGLLIKCLLPSIIKNKVTTPQQVMGLFTWVKGNNFAKSCLEMALYDLYGKINQISFLDMIGGNKKRVHMSSTISIHSHPHEAVNEAEMHIKQGVKYIKLKNKPGFDFKYIHEILKRFPDTKLMIDANASYHLNKTTLSLYKKIDKFNLYCIEQPLESYDLIDHAKLQRNLVTDLALDESIESVYDLQKAL